MTTLYLFRHGITAGNEQRLYYGSTDLSLTEHGKEEVLKRVGFGLYPEIQDYKIVTSSLVRTQETAKLIYGEDADLIVDERINEVDFGKFEMKSYDELKDDPDYQKWIDGDNWSNLCPGGESGKIMIDRARLAIDEYIKQNCIIFCHGGIIASFMMEWFPNEDGFEHFYKWQPRPCEGYKVIFDDTGLPISYEILKLDE